MWKRLPGHRNKAGKEGKENQPLQIGAPALIESSYDQEQLDRARNLSPTEEPLSGGGAYYNADIRPSRARQEPEGQLKLPSLNFSKQPPSNPAHQYRPSVAASSVYSQPDAPAISPDSSPYRAPVQDDGQVSPIDGNPPFLDPQKQRAPRDSQIPVLRKPTPSGATMPSKEYRMKEWTQKVGNSPMMWDDYSGEPTFDGAGKPSQVKPGEFNYRAGLKPVNKLQKQPMPPAEGEKAGLREKASRLAQRGLAIDTRPPWKGGSGRQAIVDAPKDKPGQTAPQPRRPEQSQTRSPDTAKPLSSDAPPYGAPASETGRVAAPQSAQGTVRAITQDNHASSRRQIGHDRNYETGVQAPSYSSPISSSSERSATPTQDQPHTSNPSNEQHPAFRQKHTPITPTQPASAAYSKNSSAQRAVPPVGNNPNSRTSGESPEQHATSRFSWTTTATNTTYQHSPPPSPPPPMPAMYINQASHSASRDGPDSSPSVPANSLLDRGHPTRRLGIMGAAPPPPSPPMSSRSFSGPTLRKPVGGAPAVQPPSPEPQVIKQQFPMADWRTGLKGKHRASSLSSPSSTSLASTVKVLPKTPQEQLASGDHVAQLQAQQDDLMFQRRNIQRLIADLEKPEAKNPLLNSFKMIRENEKRLIMLKEELDDVIQKDHDLGLRLHRAWKRRERDDPNTPGSIFWVRRATAMDD